MNYWRAQEGTVPCRLFYWTHLPTVSGGLGGGEKERPEARDPTTFRGPTILHFLKRFIFYEKYFRIFKKVLQKLSKLLKFWRWGLGPWGKCDMLLVNSILIFINKNLLKVRIAVAISWYYRFVVRGPQFFSKKKYPLFTDSNVTIEIKINANSGSNQQTMTLRNLIATRQQECQTAIEVILAEICLMSLKNLALKIIAPSYNNGRLAKTSGLHNFTL